jgi:hypothetical protein
MRATEYDDVVVRVGKVEQEPFALFPYIPAEEHCVTSYQHIGQHCSADYGLCIVNSRPATPEEAEPLLTELQQRGYRPRVIRRANWERMRRNQNEEVAPW